MRGMCSCRTDGSCAVHTPFPPAQLFNLPSPLTRSSPRVHAASKLTTSTSLPKRNSVKPLVRKSSSSSKLGLRRGKQRWSALVAAPTSRLAGMMRERLGDAAWNAFVAHANEHYKGTYVRAFDADVLRCVNGSVRSVGYDKDGGKIVSGDNDGTIKVWGRRHAKPDTNLIHRQTPL